MPLGAKILLDPDMEEQYGMIDIIQDKHKEFPPDVA